jgi:hypothetical protein
VPVFTIVSSSPYSTLKMEAVFSSETSVDFNGLHFVIARRCENLKLLMLFYKFRGFQVCLCSVRINILLLSSGLKVRRRSESRNGVPKWRNISPVPGCLYPLPSGLQHFCIIEQILRFKLFNHEDGGRVFLRNFYIHLQVYTVPQPRRPQSKLLLLTSGLLLSVNLQR